MIPGITSKVSQSRVTPIGTGVVSIKTDIVFVDPTMAVTKLIPNFGGGYSGFSVVIPIDGDLTLAAGVVDTLAVVVPAWKAAWLIYSKTYNRWFINQ